MTETEADIALIVSIISLVVSIVVLLIKINEGSI